MTSTQPALADFGTVKRKTAEHNPLSKNALLSYVLNNIHHITNGQYFRLHLETQSHTRAVRLKVKKKKKRESYFKFKVAHKPK